jgi:hypothetical protein
VRVQDVENTTKPLVPIAEETLIHMLCFGLLKTIQFPKWRLPAQKRFFANWFLALSCNTYPLPQRILAGVGLETTTSKAIVAVNRCTKILALNLAGLSWTTRPGAAFEQDTDDLRYVVLNL